MWLHPLDLVGGTTRCVTLLMLVLHFLHPLFSVATYCHWVRYERDRLGDAVIHAYLAVTVLSCVSYLFASSVFYMWAWRYPEPEELAKRRRVYGVAVNLALCDVPVFVVEVHIVWRVGFADGVQGFSFCLTCVSFAYSALRVWALFIGRIIRRQQRVRRRLATYHMPLPLHARMRGEEAPRARRAMHYMDIDDSSSSSSSHDDNTYSTRSEARVYASDGDGGVCMDESSTSHLHTSVEQGDEDDHTQPPSPPSPPPDTDAHA